MSDVENGAKARSITVKEIIVRHGTSRAKFLIIGCIFKLLDSRSYDIALLAQNTNRQVEVLHDRPVRGGAMVVSLYELARSKLEAA